MVSPRKLRLAMLAAVVVALAAPAAALAEDGWLRTDGPVTRDVNGRQVLLTGAQSVGGISDTSIAQLKVAGFTWSAPHLTHRAPRPRVLCVGALPRRGAARGGRRAAAGGRGPPADGGGVVHDGQALGGAPPPRCSQPGHIYSHP